MNPRLLLTYALLPLCLTGCMRPSLPDEDIVQPAPEPAEPVTEEPAEEPAPDEPAEPAEEAAAFRITAPAEGELIPLESPVAVSVTANPDAGITEVLVFADQNPPKLLSIADGSVEFELDAGPHVLRAVPVVDGMLSTEPDSLSVRTFSVGSGPALVPGFDPMGPILTVAQPAGTVDLPDTGEVPLDFRVDRVELSEEGQRVKWQVDGDEPEWLTDYPSPEPLSLGRLEPGKHTVKIWLEAADGQPVTNGGYTMVERSITVPSEGGAG